MSKLNIDQKTIKSLFSDKRSDFLIPDYQRPYAWGETECQALWDDIFTFAIPEDDADKFNSEDEYYLGPIVTFKNHQGKQEIIDGQQRLTTLMLLLRAFYQRSSSMQDKGTKSMRKMIEQCIWKTNEFDEPDLDKLKIDSEVATDDDKSEFLEILKQGKAPANFNSRYANNYRFFEQKISGFLESYPFFFHIFPYVYWETVFCYLLKPIIKIPPSEYFQLLMTEVGLYLMHIFSRLNFTNTIRRKEKKLNLLNVGKHWRNCQCVHSKGIKNLLLMSCSHAICII